MTTHTSIFISYHARIPESRDIARDLKAFFQNWEIECVVMELHGGAQPPIDDIQAAIHKSTHFFQILTTNPNPSEWMKNEWSWFQFHIARLASFGSCAFVLHTSDPTLLYSEVPAIRTQIAAAQIRAVNLHDEEDLGHFLAAILAHAGVLPHPNHKFVLPKFCQKAEKITFEELEKHFRYFSDANRRGLFRIYPDKQEAVKDIKDKLAGLHEAENVRMLGFTLRRFVHPFSIDEANNEVENATGRLFCEALANKGTTAQLLILDRGSDAATERMAIESPGADADKTIFFRDNMATVDHFTQHGWYNGPEHPLNKVAIKYYQNPYVGMVVFEDELFVELYHLGDDTPTPNSVAQRTICGRVPILQIKKDTSFYRLFESHFERLWERAKWAEAH